MRWVVVLSASKPDAERLPAVTGLAAHPTEAGQLLLELQVGDGDETSEGRLAVKAEIDRRVRHINGLGRLRWGRTFEGVAIKSIRSVDPAGPETQHAFLEPAYDHMSARDYARLAARSGLPSRPLPAGLEVIEALDGPAVTALADSTPVVGRVLHLVELMLEGDEQINWGAGYSALEAIEQDLRLRGVDGPSSRLVDEGRASALRGDRQQCGGSWRSGASRYWWCRRTADGLQRGELVRPPHNGALADSSHRSRDSRLVVGGRGRLLLVREATVEVQPAF